MFVLQRSQRLSPLPPVSFFETGARFSFYRNVDDAAQARHNNNSDVYRRL
jgi:hypothetical protein